MLLDILDFRMENKNKKFRKSRFENVVSDLWEKTLYVHKTTLKKVQLLKTTKN